MKLKEKRLWKPGQCCETSGWYKIWLSDGKTTRFNRHLDSIGSRSVCETPQIDWIDSLKAARFRAYVLEGFKTFNNTLVFFELCLLKKRGQSSRTLVRPSCFIWSKPSQAWPQKGTCRDQDAYSHAIYRSLMWTRHDLTLCLEARMLTHGLLQSWWTVLKAREISWNALMLWRYPEGRIWPCVAASILWM